MKICALVAEYNPLHLGHLKHIDYIKTTLGAEKIIVIMSGNFTQRGEPAILDKFERARLAVTAGADAVIELPTVFATANAEIFATGAVKILDALGVCDGLCFGVESGTADEYKSTAKALLNETKEFKRALKDKLEQGVSLAKAKFLALKEVGIDGAKEQLINSPNNVLGLEYTKAIYKLGSKMEIYPMLRDGDHNDKTLKKGTTSATSIREAVKLGGKGKIKKSVPPFVYKAIGDYPFAFDKLIMSAVISTSAEKMAEILDCTEGLENRIKALSKDNRTVDALVEKATTKRYPSTRIRRILTATLLGIDKKFVFECLDASLYAKVLAVNENCKDIIPTLVCNSLIPVLTRKSDLLALKKTAKKCFELDTLACDLYNLATDQKQNENLTLFI